MPDLPRPERTIGVFETLLIIDGTPIELEPHLERLGRSVRELFCAELPVGVRELVHERASRLTVGRLRLTVAPRDDSSLGEAVATAVVGADDLFPPWEHAVALHPFVIRGGLGAHKWADRDGLAWSEDGEAEGSLPLLLDGGEEVLETSRANVFVVEDDVLLTPAADGRILPGVTRARVIETAVAMGLEVREQRLELARMIAAGEAFLTGSVRGIESVRAVGEAELGPPGEAVNELAAEIKRGWVGGGVPGSVRTY